QPAFQTDPPNQFNELGSDCLPFVHKADNLQSTSLLFLTSSSLLGRKSSDTLFQIEQKLLPPEPASIASELPILIYYAVTWDDDGYPVLAVRMADRPLRAGRSNLPRQVFVGTSLAI